MTPLEIRLRSDLRDLNDEEFLSYVESMALAPDKDTLRSVQRAQRKANPVSRKVKTFKTVTIRGKRKRIPVGHYVQEAPVEAQSIPDGDGSEFLCEIFSTSTEIVEHLEQRDDCFAVLVGYTQEGDVVEVDGKWGVVTNILNDQFTLLFGCVTLQEIQYKLYEINQNYRIVN